MKSEPGKLYVVATPIGNLEDITLRALKILREVGLIAAEDTRTARKLLHHYGISRPLCSYYDSVEAARSPVLVKKLLSGASIALISESGMPGVSDPGYHLITRAITAGIRVVPIPGPSSVLTALVVSGLAPARFVFEGFLPSRPHARRKKLISLHSEERTLIFFETARRLRASLEDMSTIFGKRKIAIARELTKKFEQIIRGTLQGVLKELMKVETKGEVVLVVEGWKRSKGRPVGTSAALQVKKLEKEFGLTRMEAIKLTAELRGVAKPEIYRVYHSGEAAD